MSSPVITITELNKKSLLVALFRKRMFMLDEMFQFLRNASKFAILLEYKKSKTHVVFVFQKYDKF